jgi:hypothetical protein
MGVAPAMTLDWGRVYPAGNPHCAAGRAAHCRFAGLLWIRPADRPPLRPITGFDARTERELVEKAKALLAKWERENGCNRGSARLEVWLYSPRPSKATIGGNRPKRLGRTAPVFNTV